jgi:hypothetical protein
MRATRSTIPRTRWATVLILVMSILALTGAHSANAAVTAKPAKVQDRLASAEPRPDLAGLRIKAANAAPIYLIDPEGYRRWIPDPVTFDNLFRGWDGVIVVLDIASIAARSNISSGAVLIRGNGRAPVYLVSNGFKRWITSPAAMDKYYFDWNKVQVLPPIVVDSIQTGASWS